MNAILIPAYGKQYSTLDDMIRGWNNGDDFRIIKSPKGNYCSKRDIVALLEIFDSVTLHAPTVCEGVQFYIVR